MSAILPRSHQRFNWKLYGFILLLAAIGAMAKIPSALYMEGLVERPETWSQVSIVLFLQDFLILGLIPAGIGLLVIYRTGLRLPVLERLVFNQKIDIPAQKWMREALLLALILGCLGVILQAATRPLIMRDLGQLGIDPQSILQSNHPAPWWAMSLLAISAGIIEEVAFRLGLFSFISWLGSLVWKPKDGRLRSGVFWTVNILIAILFSLAHFANVTAAGVPLVMGLILRVLVGNTLAALVFGWLYWKRGLVSAMLTHTILDGFVYVIAPLFLGLFA